MGSVYRIGFSTYTVGDDVRVAVQRALGVTVLGLIAGEVPDDQGLVTRGGQEHVRAAAGILLALQIFAHGCGV